MKQKRMPTSLNVNPLLWYKLRLKSVTHNIPLTELLDQALKDIIKKKITKRRIRA